MLEVWGRQDWKQEGTRRDCTISRPKEGRQKLRRKDRFGALPY